MYQYDGIPTLNSYNHKNITTHGGRYRLALSLLVCLSALSLSCSRQPPSESGAVPATTYRDPDTAGKVESVMTHGVRITAITPQGSILVYAGEDYTRTYTWDGASRSVKLIPRKNRWYGSLGLYYPGQDTWEAHNGITRGVFNEGQMHFESSDEALGWIHSRTFMPHVYRNDGLVVGWYKNAPESPTLMVDIWQIYIRGAKPSSLPGAQDGAIVVEHGR